MPKIKTKISLQDSTMAKTPPSKAADKKPIFGQFPEEVNQVLRNSSLPEEHVFVTFILSDPPPTPNPKKRIKINWKKIASLNGMKILPLFLPSLNPYSRPFYYHN